jgi:hypothetical protein
VDIGKVGFSIIERNGLFEGWRIKLRDDGKRLKEAIQKDGNKWKKWKVMMMRLGGKNVME